MNKNAKKIIISIWSLFFVFFLILLVNFISNEVMIKKYNKRVYEFNKLWFLGFTQPYVSPYNKGNIYYKMGEYELAISCYDDALEKWPSQSAECDIRVNKAQSMLKLIDYTMETKADVDPIIDQLLPVEDVLLANNCANIDKSSGHDEDAQQLFNEIDEYIDRLADYKDTFTYYGQKIFKDDYGNDRQLQGKDFEFSFIECDENGEPLSTAEEVISNNEADGFIRFNTITFKLSDAGTHYYKITEVKGDNPYIDYSDKVYIVKHELTLSHNERTLDSVITYFADDPIASQIKFGNVIHIPDQNNGGGGSDGDGGGSSGQDGNDGGSSQDPGEDPNGGGNDDGNDSGNDGGTAEQPMDPIEQQLQEYMNQANEERYDDLNGDNNHYYNYNDDNFW